MLKKTIAKPFSTICSPASIAARSHRGKAAARSRCSPESTLSPPAVHAIASHSTRRRLPQCSPSQPAIDARSRPPHCSPSPPALLTFATLIAASSRRLPRELQSQPAVAASRELHVGASTPPADSIRCAPLQSVPRRCSPLQFVLRRCSPLSCDYRPQPPLLHVAAPGRCPRSLPQVAASLPTPPDTRGPDYAC
jgi:hypothetical protein